MNKGEISILGCGWLGVPLAKHFIEEGFLVRGSVTNPEKFALLRNSGILPFRLVLNNSNVEVDDLQFFDCEVLIVSIPPGRSSGNVQYFPNRIRNLIPLIRKAEIRKIILISSTSVYPENLQVAREDDLPVPEKESGKVLLDAENLLKEQTAFQTTVIRFGGLIGADRNPARFLQRVSDQVSNAPVNLIHQDDCIQIISEIIKQELWGETLNACSPEHPMKGDFYRKAARISGLPEPLISDRIEDHKIVDSSKLIRLLDYQFIYPSPMDYLDSISSD